MSERTLSYDTDGSETVSVFSTHNIIVTKSSMRSSKIGGGGILGKLRTKVPKSFMRSSIWWGIFSVGSELKYLYLTSEVPTWEGVFLVSFYRQSTHDRFHFWGGGILYLFTLDLAPASQIVPHTVCRD